MIRAHVVPIAPVALVFGCTGAPPAATTPLPCGPPVSGAELATPGRMLVLGEIHGTTEVPALVGAVVCQALAEGPVLVALERPRTEQPLIDALLAAPDEGLAAAEAALLATEGWAQWHDGRSSAAMRDLLVVLRTYARAGAPVSVVAFDVAPNTVVGDRDAAMAERLAAAHRDAPGGRRSKTIALTGNLHSRTAPLTLDDGEMTPMVAHLRADHVDAVSLDLRSAGGTAWVCLGDLCGVAALRASDPTGVSAPALRLGTVDGHDGLYVLDAVSASLPATTGPDTDPVARGALARAAYEAGDFAGCALHNRTVAAASAGKYRMNALYDAACCEARAGEPVRAVAALEAAIAAGWRDRGALTGGDGPMDPDLASLQADPAFLAVVARLDAAEAARDAASNAELAEIYRADQSDRQGPMGDDTFARDRARFARVTAMIDAGALATADDYFRAAMVFQHGEDAAAAARARELAQQAVALDPNHHQARWLVAAATDRERMRLGQPQHYGTQYTKQDGVWTFYPCDPETTDLERAAWGVPPLAEALERVAWLNARDAAAAAPTPAPTASGSAAGR